MPRFDGTGPNGKGPGSGHRMGNCSFDKNRDDNKKTNELNENEPESSESNQDQVRQGQGRRKRMRKGGQNKQ